MAAMLGATSGKGNGCTWGSPHALHFSPGACRVPADAVAVRLSVDLGWERGVAHAHSTRTYPLNQQNWTWQARRAMQIYNGTRIDDPRRDRRPIPTRIGPHSRRPLPLPLRNTHTAAVTPLKCWDFVLSTRSPPSDNPNAEFSLTLKPFDSYNKRPARAGPRPAGSQLGGPGTGTHATLDVPGARRTARQPMLEPLYTVCVCVDWCI